MNCAQICPVASAHVWKVTDDEPRFTYCRACGCIGPGPDPQHPEPNAFSDRPINEAAQRPSWAETWMNVARTIAARSYDPRLRVGAIVVSDDNTQVLSVGYNGSYRGGPHQHESSEPGRSGFIHAEVNALVKCDYNFPKHKHMYVTHSPCADCAKLIINADIKRVVYEVPYRSERGIELLRSVGLEVLQLGATIHTA